MMRITHEGTTKYVGAWAVLPTCVLIVACTDSAPAAPPYQQSAVVFDVIFDWQTHNRLAPGSDNWPVTWADDDHQYTCWGDGGGFGGTNADGRVSLGFARVEGSRNEYHGRNLWGGHTAPNRATFEGKCRGILALDSGTLYAWRTPSSGPAGYSEARLAKSTDRGASWMLLDWHVPFGITMPTFLQFGQDYSGARDVYVYTYWVEVKDQSELQVQKPGEIMLSRVPKAQLEIETAHEWFNGFDETGGALWGQREFRQPVFSDSSGVGWSVSVSFNPGLRAYLLITEHGTTADGNIGIFDAPTPWGPWTTVLYSDEFGADHIQQSSFFWNFSNKWLAANGRDFVLVFTGIEENDSWNTVEGRFVTAQDQGIE